MKYSNRTEVGERFYSEVRESWKSNAKNFTDLSDDDIHQLMHLFTEMWGDLSRERNSRSTFPIDTSEEPIWAAIRSGGINVEPRNVIVHGKQQVVWIWSIPSSKMELPTKAGFDDRASALQDAIRWLVLKIFFRRFWPF